MKWIRWKYFIPLLIVVVSIVVFFVLFFDPLLARIIEKVGGKVNGAKVEVVGLKTKLFQGRMDISHLQVANPESLMQNTVEAGPLAFQIDFSALIIRRVLINEAKLSGLAFDTTRKTSGALPIVFKKKDAGPPSAAEKLVSKYQERFKLNIDGIKGDAKAKIEFDPKDLELTKSAEGIKEKAEVLPGNWEKRVKDLNAEERLKNIEAELKVIKETPTSGTEALTAIPASLKKLSDVKNQLDTLKKEVQTTKSDILAESNELKTDVVGLSAAKKRDLDDLMSRLNMDFASPDRLVEGLIGPAILKRFQTIFHYVQLAREHMPSKKEKESLPPKPRAKGMDIEFPTPAAPPRFWLVKGLLDGTYESIQAAGEVSNLTTDPSRVGKPFKLDMRGNQGRQKFLLNATLDHTKDVNADSFIFQADGIDVKKLVPATEGTPADFTQGVGRLDVALNLIGQDSIGGEIGLSLSGLKFDDAALLAKVGVSNTAALTGGDKLKADFMRNVARAIEGMKEVSINAHVTGRWSDPNLKITSNLALALTNVIKDSVGNLVKDQRAELEGKLNKILIEKQGEANKLLAGLDSKVNGQLGGLETQISQKISEATGINLKGEGDSPIPGVKIPSLNKLFKK